MFLAIFKLLAREDIKHFRLVCRLWELLGAPFLMNRVFFGPRRKIMDNFTAISRHPIFSKSIKQIAYDVALNDASLLDLEIYKEEFDVSYAPIDEGVYQRGLDRYREVFSDEQAILDTGEDFAVLKAGMDLMPNAKSFLLSDGLRHRCLWHWYHDLDPGFWDASPAFPLSYFYSRCDRPGVSWDLRVVRSILRAMSLSDTRVESLTLGVGGSKDRGAVPFTPTRFTGVESGHACGALRSLTKLSIQFKPNSHFNIHPQREETRALVGWLSEAQNLAQLTLDFCPALDWDASHELLETAVWPSLQAVRIANIRTHTFLAAGFLERHRLEADNFDFLLKGGGLEFCSGLAASTSVHLKAKSARDKFWWCSNIKLLKMMGRGSENHRSNDM